MHVVSVINYKGGVGKTSVTANLGAELAWRGLDVLLLDLDPQASLTFSFLRPEDWEQDLADSGTIKSWFDSFASGPPLALETLIQALPLGGRLEGHGRLDLIPSHLGLINVDLELATELGGATLRQAKQNYLRVHRRLSEGLAALEQAKYDLVLIDCPPNFNVVTKTAIVACNHVLIPAKPDFLSTLGIDYLIRSLNQLVKDYNEYAAVDAGEHAPEISPEILGVVFTMVQEYGRQPISAIRPFIRQVRELNIPVFDSYIKENKTLFADAPQYGVPVVLSVPSPSSHRQVVAGIEQFVNEFVDRLALQGTEDGPDE